MIILKAGIPNKIFQIMINRNKVSFCYIYLVVFNYFMGSKENFYFLILSLFSFYSSYINLIPKHYSPQVLGLHLSHCYFVLFWKLFIIIVLGFINIFKTKKK